ncbi:hypothetical protein BDR26DRAFT_865289 [Obelidium mucronatum]|nr:hypothetical protein BDR26DRAFT_865289 [Obelidium mucronatum]
MAATVQINPTTRSRRRIPSDPMDENIYNMVLRPGIEDRPPPLYKSKFAHHVRSEHLKARRTVSNPAAIPLERDHIARSAIPVSGIIKSSVKAGFKSSSKSEKEKNGKSTTTTAKQKDPTKIHAPKSVTKPISKPTSGRIAMAAERRSNAATPVVADPNSWDHIAAEAGDEPPPPVPVVKKTLNYEEVPEELIEHWEPFNQDTDEGLGRQSSPTPREMETGSVRKQGIKKGGVAKGSAPILSGSNIGGGNRRRMLPEAERLAVLAGLKSNYQSLMGIYNRLSVADDTVSKRNRKTSIEKQLTLLEEDIKKFSHPNIIIDEGN